MEKSSKIFKTTVTHVGAMAALSHVRLLNAYSEVTAHPNTFKENAAHAMIIAHRLVSDLTINYQAFFYLNLHRIYEILIRYHKA